MVNVVEKNAVQTYLTSKPIYTWNHSYGDILTCEKVEYCIQRSE
jgi:hypothetical protein